MIMKTLQHLLKLVAGPAGITVAWYVIAHVVPMFPTSLQTEINDGVPGGNLLEVGCGSGAQLAELQLLWKPRRA